MGLKAVYDKIDDVPEPHRELFEERGGKFQLTKIEGLITEADLARVKRALDQEKAAHAEAKNKLSVWGDLNHEEVHQKLDRIGELEAAASDKLDKAKIDEIVEGRLKTRLSPLEREKKKLEEKLAQHVQLVETFTAKERQRAVHDAVRKAATDNKVVSSAIEDVLLLGERVFEITEEGKIVTKEGVGVTPGVGPDVWLQELQDKRPHWWPPSNGGGAKGSGNGGQPSNNPWHSDSWSLTAQGQYVRQHGLEKANQMAKSAGTTVGGQRPKPKAA